MKVAILQVLLIWAGLAIFVLLPFRIECTTEPTDRARTLSPTHLSPEPDSTPSSTVARSVPLEPEADSKSSRDNDPQPAALPAEESPPAFSSKTVQAFVEKHPNTPLRFVPHDATSMQLAYLEGQVEVILKDWQKVKDELWSAHQENLLAFTVDPNVIQNDRDRQSRLKSLVNSLWPNAMP